MNSVPLTPAQHHREAERLLATAESPAVDPGLRDLAARLALAHAVLTLSPRRARREPAETGRLGGDNPTARWLRGDDL